MSNPPPPSQFSRRAKDGWNTHELPPAPSPAPAVQVKPEDQQKKLDVAKTLLDKSAETNRNLLIAFYALLTTSLILCLSVTDEMLLVGSTTIKIPLISVDLPIWAFASIAPFFVMVLHFDLLHNLNEHSRKLGVWVALWEAKHGVAQKNQVKKAALWRRAGRQIGHLWRIKQILPRHLAKTYLWPNLFIRRLWRKKSRAEKPGATISENCYPFVYDFAWLYEKGKGGKRASSTLLPLLCWLLYCWLPFVVLMAFMMRFADLQDYLYTSFHLALMIFDLIWIKKFWPGFVKRQRGLRTFFNALAWAPGMWVFVLYCLIQYCMETNEHLENSLELDIFNSENEKIQTIMEFNAKSVTVMQSLNSREWVELSIYLESKQENIINITLTPRIVVPNFQAKLPEKFFDIAELRKPGIKKEELINGMPNLMNFKNRHFGFAVLDKARIPYSDFSFAKLKYANMFGVDFDKNNFEHAQLQGASLYKAQLQGARLYKAQLQGASLVFAQLQGANLNSAQLQGASFDSAQLQGASFESAQLQGASLWQAQLQGASLWQAELQGASLWQAQLQGANLASAQLQGARLASTELHGSDIANSKGLAATIGEYSFSKKCDFKKISQEPWAKNNARITFAVKRCTKFTHPSLPAQNIKTFTAAWKAQLCESEAIAKNMLLMRPREIPAADLRKWMATQEKCKPFIQYVEEDLVLD
ncbi:pentapeptide repeat-containing protein [Massilia sp. W12]|uniref:pentapeptide repeat-containing protein n=1 Tax=Massilia sp. W12 TaxID=3126507 RepID=UPI0030D1A933